MDHKEQHHQHHQHEREEEKRQHKAHAHEGKKSGLPVHPAWLFVLGAVLVFISILIYIYLSS